jgi:2-polyprenyl-6-methoxyphenol hydroxylase-like FAD-dependent oxidoreductase
VLIVGAGPTGLVLANALAAYGVPFCIVDQKSGPNRDSKGLALNIGSQFGLELIGLGGSVGARGCAVRRLNVLWQGRRLNPIDFRHLGLPWGHFITQPQANTETELVEALARRGIAVQWDTQLVDLAEGPDSVTATLADAGTARRRQDFGYVVGCDGKHSLVRQAMGAELSGHDHDMYFALGDFAFDWRLDPGQVYYHVHEETFFLFVPIGDGVWRVVVKHDGAMPRTDLAVSEITDVLRRYLGDVALPETARWMSRAAFYTRVSSHLNRRRLFIAGDAAHLFVPIGGTGMNTGIQDALNLAWRLALAARGLAHASLLDGYEAERLPVIAATAAATDRSLRLIARLDSTPAALAELMPTMANRRAIRHTLPERHAGVNLSYAPAMPPSNHAVAKSHPEGRWCFGLPQLRALAGRPSGDLALLAVLRLDDVPDGDGLLALQAMCRTWRACGGTLHLQCLATDAPVVRALGSMLADMPVALADAALLTRCGLNRSGDLLVLRPDGIVALSRSTDAPLALDAFMRSDFMPAPAHA